ncbi:L-aspartate aminotransferase apoenzyme [Pelosinus propionicus DSM 13327]|uniref:Aminotransferase n=2 Tax=Pelosinus TaxID=365348 RepID=A0A1I4NIQ9_9FIRM|nr:L-aspartate aminotransferase apoenzyme [Pelosinus propionicus DSM 13327]
MLSRRAGEVQPSPTVALSGKIAELRRQGTDIISFNIGEPDFPTPDYIKKAAFEAVNQNFTKYPPTGGFFDLQEAVVNKLRMDNGVSYDPKQICVSNGAKQSVLNALYALCGEGDEVIIPVPCWVSYTEMVKLTGAVSVLVEADEKRGFALDLAAIEAAITPRTKVIIINTPNNPSGAIYSEESLRKLAAMAVEHDFYIISDEIYEKLIYDGEKHFCIGSISPEVQERCVIINGVSKAYAMPGWRIGYSASAKPIAKAINAFQSQMTSGACAISQKAALAAITGPQNDLSNMREEYDKRRRFMQKRLNELDGFTCDTVKGAFYLLPDISALLGRGYAGKTITSSMDLAAFFLEEAHVAVVPGEAFNTKNKLRFSYANSMENIVKGLERIEAAIAVLS